MLQPLQIVIDSREQAPWSWDQSEAQTQIRALVAGDYALLDDCEAVKGRESMAVRFAIERKSMDDFVGTIGAGWVRFQRELDRMATFPARVIIVEGNFEETCFDMVDGRIRPPKHNHPGMTPAFVSRRIAELTMMSVSVLFAGSAAYGSALAYRIFRRRVESCR